MTAVITTPAQIINLVAARLGKSERVGHLYEGSKISRLALSIYGQTRDEMLRDGDYDFAERNINMTLLKFAPANGYFPPNVWNGLNNPPLPWMFEYAYPGDCLKVRAVKPTPMSVVNYDPQPNVFSVENDQFFIPPQKVILCNLANAQLVYTGQITDPTTWEADFVEELADMLAVRLSVALGNPEIAKQVASEAGQAMSSGRRDEA